MTHRADAESGAAADPAPAPYDRLRDSLRDRLREAALHSGDALVEMARRLVRADSQNPPGDTSAVSRTLLDLIEEGIGDTAAGRIGTTLHHAAHVTNVVAVLKGGRPGRRVILSSHLDTYPAGAGWTHDPLGGEVVDGRLYGRGSCDMKGGLAASLAVMQLFARHVPEFPGEIVLAAAGDEETMGELGTQALIDALAQCRGDAVIVPDVGGPRVPRCGEKGMLWLQLSATGKAAHGAHVHRGENAIDRLTAALAALKRFEDMRMPEDHPAAAVMAAAEPVSEPLAGAGEREIMSRVTVNTGRIAGGISANLVPDSATAEIDIRIPLGITTAEIEARMSAEVATIPGVTWTVTRRYEASWTDPSSPVVRLGAAAAEEVLGQPVAVNMRIGGSDARLWRRAGMPTLVCGLTAHNLGAPDENLDVAELPVLAAILALSVHDILHETPGGQD